MKNREVELVGDERIVEVVEREWSRLERGLRNFVMSVPPRLFCRFCVPELISFFLSGTSRTRNRIHTTPTKHLRARNQRQLPIREVRTGAHTSSTGVRQDG